MCAGGWVKLNGGTKYRFNADDSSTAGRNKIRLKASTGGSVAADAVRISKTGTGGSTTRKFVYRYDTNGNLEKLTRAQGATDTDPTPTDTLDVVYDTLNRAKTVTSTWSGAEVTTDYKYDENSNIDTVFANHTGNTDTTRNTADLFTDYTYDVRDLVRDVKTGTSDGVTTKTTSYTYDGTGRRISVTKPNGNIARYSYFRDGRLKISRELNQNTDLVARHVLTYTPDGHRATEVSQIRPGGGATGFLDQTSTYTYSGAGQLTAVVKTGAEAGSVESYTYDAAGNTIKADVENIDSVNTYKNNRLIRSAATKAGVTTTYDHGYDPFGRQVTAASTAAATW